MSYYVVQGLAQAIYETCGNFLTLNIWSNISESPLNVVHAGYGVGALLSIQLARPFIKFTSQQQEFQNSTITQTIDLTAPYWSCSLFSFLVGFLFVLSQLVESDTHKHNTNWSAKYRQLKETTNAKRKLSILSLFLLVCLFIQGYLTTISRFMLTYLTRGPPQLTLSQFSLVQTFFWLFFILGRFAYGLIGYFKLKNCRQNSFFFLVLLFLNLIISVVMVVSEFVSVAIDWYWWMLVISLLGLISGPLTPGIIMLAKQVMASSFNMSTLSMFVACNGLGSIAFQQVTGSLLDLKYQWMKSTFVLPYVAMVATFFSFVFFLIIYLIFTEFKSEVKQ